MADAVAVYSQEEVDKKTPKKSKKGGYKKMSNVIEGVGSFDLVLVDPTGDGRREAISDACRRIF